MSEPARQLHLPDFLLDALRKEYFAAVTSAELCYEFSEGDEDSLTGALGQALDPHLVRQVGTDEGERYEYRIFYHKIRGRGPKAPEKPLGADGIFQLEVRSPDGELLQSKGLLFQSKKEWRGTDRSLAGQAERIAHPPTKGIVIDYSASGYSAWPAAVVAAARGNRRAIPEEDGSRLADVLGNQFTRCRMGLVGLRYDPDREVLSDPTDEAASLRDGAHVLTTLVSRVS